MQAYSLDQVFADENGRFSLKMARVNTLFDLHNGRIETPVKDADGREGLLTLYRIRPGLWSDENPNPSP